MSVPVRVCFSSFREARPGPAFKTRAAPVIGPRCEGGHVNYFDKKTGEFCGGWSGGRPGSDSSSLIESPFKDWKPRTAVALFTHLHLQDPSSVLIKRVPRVPGVSRNNRERSAQPL